MPLYPCRESRREHTIAGPEEHILASQYWLGRTLDVRGWIFEIWRSSDLQNPSNGSPARKVLLESSSGIELQPLSMMMSGSSLAKANRVKTKRLTRNGIGDILAKALTTAGHSSERKCWNGNRRTSSRTLESSLSGLDPNGTA
jgi:hypothetical protein